MMLLDVAVSLVLVMTECEELRKSKTAEGYSPHVVHVAPASYLFTPSGC